MDESSKVDLEPELTEKIIGAAIEVHRTLGPGLLESCYEACLTYELINRGLQVQRQVNVPVIYNGKEIDCGYRLDLLIERKVIIEVKSVEDIAPIHVAQLMTYLRLSGHRVGLLINFNVKVLKDGIRSRVI